LGSGAQNKFFVDISIRRRSLIGAIQFAMNFGMISIPPDGFRIHVAA